MQPQILVLKEGTDQSQGRPQLISNINACQLVVDAVRTTLGPRGMDKLIVDHSGKAVISNDGATIMKLLDIVHPAAKTLVDIAKSQDAEVGDGTTSVVILAGELLKRLKPFVEEGVHPRILVRAVRSAAKLAVDRIRELAVKMDSKSPQEQRDLLRKCAATAMASKLIHRQKDHFSAMVVDAVLSLDAPLLPLDMIGIKKVSGGALEDSFLVAGVAFKKTFSYAGFEMQPKSYDSCKIALLNIELELKAERDNAEVRVDNVKEYQKVVDAEWQILYEKLEALHKSGANVVLSKLPIGDVATQYFADRDMFCAGRVPEEDLRRTQRACGGAVLSSARAVPPDALGHCAHFTERQIGGERYNIFTGYENRGRPDGCPAAKTCTMILRGGAEQFLEETERSLHDAIMIVRRSIKNDALVAGEKWYGVDIQKEDIADNFASCVWEPAVVKINAVTAACEAAAQILSVDETIKNVKGGDAMPQAGGMPAGMGRGMGRPRMG
ncbi:T-complex protein 1 subunit eta isoform X3 [Cydia pomonella]|uniref:T-complex protein 1 subunit eta isoform X3 n=1 Tax=Cydia pomonella TaxID=82600 RepID=UPI002ADE8BD4|nr:T-complex protein 1 subunit eta isoform X3 [Cydia pomonella]